MSIMNIMDILNNLDMLPFFIICLIILFRIRVFKIKEFRSTIYIILLLILISISDNFMIIHPLVLGIIFFILSYDALFEKIKIKNKKLFKQYNTFLLVLYIISLIVLTFYDLHNLVISIGCLVMLSFPIWYHFKYHDNIDNDVENFYKDLFNYKKRK